MNIEVMSRSEAERKDAHSGMWCLSITDVAAEDATLRGYGRVGRFAFDDVKAGHGLAMNDRDASRIWRFVEQALDANIPHMVIHCEAGISRSAAVASAIVNRHGDRVTWLNRAARLYVAGQGEVPRFNPNPHVYWLLTGEALPAGVFEDGGSKESR